MSRSGRTIQSRGKTFGVRTELKSFIEWVRHDAEPVLTASEGLRAVEIIEAAYRSIEEKGRVALPLMDRS